MRKLGFGIIVVLLLVSIFALVSCAEEVADGTPIAPMVFESEDLLADASFSEWKNNDFGGGYMDVTLEEPVTFNTAVIEEEGDSVQYFRLQHKTKEGDVTVWKTFYQSEKIEKLRVCSFDGVTASEIRISVDKVHEGEEWKIKSFKLYNEKGRLTEERDFVVAAYQRLDGDVPTKVLENMTKAKAGDPEFKDWDRYPEYYDTYNTIIIFGAVNWDKDGNMTFGAGSEEAFAAEIDALKQIIAMRKNKDRNVNLVIGAIADGAGGNDFGAHNGANTMIDRHYDKVMETMLTFLEKYQFDGVDIDWEYPKNSRDWALFDKFITELNEKWAKDKILSGALNAGSLGMSKEVLNMFDQVQFMAYDGHDRDGFQSSLQQAQDGLTNFIKNGFDIKKINIGIATFAKPVNNAGYWLAWRKQKGNPNLLYWNSKFYNVTLNETLTDEKTGEKYEKSSFMDAAYCSPALAGDKLTYALFAGVGGVMVFRLACDKYPWDENSVAKGLLNAMERYK